MKTYQKIFTESYVNKLLDSVKRGENLEFYKKAADTLDHAGEEICFLTNIEHPEGLARTMENFADVKSDFDAGKRLFEAYENISPMLASYAPFWVYLSHVELHDYMRRRWSEVKNIGHKSAVDIPDYIIKYWFYRSPMSSWLSGLWWSFQSTVDKERDDKYELTKVLFTQQDLRTRTFGTYSISRHKEASIAVLEFIRDNQDGVLSTDFQDKCRYIMKYLNRLGGSIQVASLDRNYFRRKLDSKIYDIEHNYK